MSEALADDPNRRLDFFKELLSPRKVGLRELLDVALLGLGDAWSVIRTYCAHHIALAVQTMGQREPINYMELILRQWQQATEWFRYDGLLLFLKSLLSIGVAQPVEFVANPEAVNIIFASLTHPQLPVRQTAVEIAALLAERDPMLAQRIQEFVLSVISESGGHDDHAICGALAVARCHVKFAETIVEKKNSELFRALVGHPAATVRQLVADLYSLPLPQTMTFVTEELHRRMNCPSDWREIETLMMALNGHLLRYCRSGDVHIASSTHSGLEECYCGNSRLLVDVLGELLVSSSSSLFEIHRMSVQLIPLLLQYLVRTSPPMSVLSTVASLGAHHESTIPKVLWFLAILKNLYQDLAPEVTSAVALFTQRNPAILNDSLTSQAIIGTYFSASPSPFSWSRVLRHDPSVSCYCMDAAATSCNPLSFISDWAAVTLETPLVHTQAHLLEAIRVGLLFNSTRPLFLFSIRSEFSPPSIIDGGDDTHLGYSWIKSICIYESRLPVFAIARSPQMTKDEWNCLIRESSSARITTQVVVQLLQSRDTEPSVVTAARQLALALFDAGVVDVEELCRTFLLRLTRSFPSWRDDVSGTSDDTRVHRKTGNGWDDSDEDVEGSSAAAELAATESCLAQLQERISGTPVEDLICEADLQRAIRFIRSRVSP